MRTESEQDAMEPTAALRARRNGHPGCILWLTGLSASGKSTIATQLQRRLFAKGRQVYLLDGDVLRNGLCSDLSFTPEHRHENLRRAGAVAALFADAGMICIAAFISPYRADRAMVRAMAGDLAFLEVFVNAPLAVCERRDPKGLYAKARAGRLSEFTGISAPYEAPLKPDLELRTDLEPLSNCVEKTLSALQQLIGPIQAGYASPPGLVHA